jgi:hypothetical protein
VGYKRASARAKIAHDVVLAAIKASGMKDYVTIKGGVVMSGMTQAARRATMDMDADFVRYSLSNVAIEKFVSNGSLGLFFLFDKLSLGIILFLPRVGNLWWIVSEGQTPLAQL